VYLEAGEYEAALRLCSSPAQRDAVHLARAEPAFLERDYLGAATSWGRVVGGRPAFEDLALRLVEAGDAAALEAFLSTRLQVCGRGQGGRRGGGEGSAARQLCRPAALQLCWSFGWCGWRRVVQYRCVSRRLLGLKLWGRGIDRWGGGQEGWLEGGCTAAAAGCRLLPEPLG
jgi:hypothetical protein